MASLSLPRVLQLKKNPLDVERENFEKFQSLSISKAINSQETPVKEKHVRSTIIGSFQEQGAVTYWVVAIRLPLQDNRIVAWKFCHVTHKLLREGHPACLDDSQRHIGMMENLGKLWVHLREGYGKLINLYTSLLACKLRFHSRNPQFPGNMAVTAEELDAIAENDVNNYFQLCVELFDYMDDILNLQAAVFDSLGNARANSMTASGQCRLAALIPCAQDSSHIYDCNVRLLFRLHAALPPDTLSGHRERFRQQFKKLSAFYKHASTMQYFRNLLTLPQLPNNPPNFLIQSDFGTYVAPVVMIPEPDAELEQDTVGSLIDTSDTFSQMTSPDSQDFVDSRTTPSPQPDLVLERDRLIEHLQAELRRQRAELTQMTDERGSMLVSMRDHCSKLEAELAHAKNAMEEEKQRAEILFAQTPEITQKLNAVEERAKVTDDKFQKLKGAYTQLREEHIGLLRQKAEVDKLSASLRTAAAEHESAKVALQQQLSDRSRDVEQLQQSASNSEAITNELDTLRNEIVTLQTNLAQSREREKELEELKATVEETQQQHKMKAAEAQEQISRIEEQTRELSELLENTKREKDERENDLERLREEIVVLKDKSGEEFSKVVEEKEAALKEVATLTEQFQQEKQEMGKQLEFIKNNMSEVELRETAYKEDVNSLRSEIETARNELENLQENKEKEVSELNIKVATLTNILKDNDESYQKNLLKQKEETESLKEILKKSSEESETFQQHILLLKDEEIANYKGLLKDSSEKIEAAQKHVLLKEEEIQHLKGVLKESSEKSEASQKELHLKDEEIEKMEKQLKEYSEKCEAMEKDVALKDSEIEYLEDILGKTSEEKEHTYEALKSELEDKENKINALTFDVDNLSADFESVKNEMEEREAELEITKNEFISLKKKHADYAATADTNLANASELLDKYKKELDSVVSEKQGLINQISTINIETVQNEKDYNEKISNLQNSLERLQGEHNRTETEKDATITELSNQVAVLLAERNQIKSRVNSEVQRLQDELHNSAIKQNNDNQIFEQKLLENKTEMEALSSKMEELHKEKEETITKNGVLLRQYEEENKNLERKFEHSEKERLTAECELQDLLQHNTSLEDNLNAVKNHLQKAQEELERYQASMVRTAAEAGAELLQDALGELEQGASPASGAQAAERASLALHQLATPASTVGDHQTGEKETAAARSMVRAAHHTAQLAAHTSDLLATLTDHDLVDSVTSETRTMLSLTKQCMEELARGEHAETSARAEEARARVAALAQRTAAVAAARGAARCVDDELADMDRAIEEAADRIEEMLAASRAADSGVKLEVNNKILDACTTLMGAVKVLVQDARRLQNELGDPKTRLNMYRRNPQWSEGLISAAKAVVVAAKLLVTSADEAVCGAGAIEGVSAASHEVAGSTAQLVAASRARAPPASPALAALSQASRNVAAATGAVVAAVRAASALTRDHDDLETSALTLTATRRLEMESKVRSLELECALDAERARLAALRRRHYQLAQQEENGNMTNGGH